jgi:hypothetical protein
VGNEGNRRGKRNMGLVYYEDGDGNGNGNGNCLKEKGVGQGGKRGNVRMGLFLLIVFMFDRQNCCCKNEQRRRGGRRRMWFEFTLWAFYFLD